MGAGVNGDRDRDRERDRDRDRYPAAGDRDRYPGVGDRDRYPAAADRDRYPGDRDRDRYPDPYPPERYADRYGDRRYPDRERDRDRDRLPYRPLPYPGINDNSLASDLPHTRPYPTDDDAPFRPYGGYGGGRYGENRYDSRYPPRFPPGRERDPVGGYTGRDAPDSIFPDRRYRPSSMDSPRYPYLPDSRGPPGRYDDIVHSARRPEPDSAKRYPPAPIANWRRWIAWRDGFWWLKIAPRRGRRLWQAIRSLSGLCGQ